MKHAATKKPTFGPGALTKAECLGFLHHAAVAFNPSNVPAVFWPAAIHGENAVRAIRVCSKATTAPPTIVGPFESKARSEARLAFRAALNAVGLRSL